MRRRQPPFSWARILLEVAKMGIYSVTFINFLRVKYIEDFVDKGTTVHKNEFMDPFYSDSDDEDFLGHPK